MQIKKRFFNLLKRTAKKLLLPGSKYGWFGDYANWALAKAQTTGYDDGVILNKVKNALLKVKKGVLYKVDSIRQLGNAKMSNKFLQRYLSISNGSLYNKTKLQQVNKLLLELPHVQQAQPSDITLLGSGSVVNLYLAAKKVVRLVL